VAVSRLAVDDLPSASIADQVALIARKNLAPQALAIDEGTIYPDELLRRLAMSGRGAVINPNRMAQPICACAISIDRRPRRGLRRHRLHGRGARTHWLVRRQFKQSEADRKIRRQIRDRENSRRHRLFQPD